uniref:Poly [ADP-ribose] polymerase n=1 Tax=Oryzias latipes TaxID=8090 RepID=A0A3B3IP01_ORYLA
FVSNQARLQFALTFLRSGSSSFSVVSSPSLGVYHMQLGQLTLEVSSGDITKESCDAIVNSTNSTFDLNTGVSKAILSSAGPTVQRECAQIVASPGYQPGGMIMTGAGLLPCRHIVHITIQNNVSHIKNMVFKVLKLCEKNKFTSVAFPALGTGTCEHVHTHTCKPCMCADMSCLHTYMLMQTMHIQTRTFGFSITIDRVQNSCLWQSFQLLKKQMELKNKHNNNEKVLFHGTSADSTDQINTKGFNRSYAGRNGAMFGNGSYFAVDPAYSAQNYAQPDNQGHKRMYQARVLVGDFTQGSSGMIIPPSKSGQSADLYDSVTDNINSPTMFVVFNDTQAYPEYLITFT